MAAQKFSLVCGLMAVMNEVLELGILVRNVLTKCIDRYRWKCIETAAITQI
jgi:hypothetical protein